MAKFTFIPRTLCAMTLCVGLATTSYANLLTNGSFEQGNLVNNGQATMTLAPGSSAIPGWTVGTDNVAWIDAGNPYALSAQDGNRFLDLTDYSTGAPFGGVTQTIPTTSGQSYVLSFYLGTFTGRWGGPPVSIQASAGGTTQTFTDSSVTSTSTWTSYSLPFIAAGTSTAITLTGAAGVQYIGLDNIMVEPGGIPPIPEPNSLLLLLLGLGGVAYLVRVHRADRKRGMP